MLAKRTFLSFLVVLTFALISFTGCTSDNDAPPSPSAPAGIYVANGGNSTITAYDLSASGDTAPVRTIGGANTGFVDMWLLTVDQTNGEIITLDYNAHSVSVFNTTDDGNVAPQRTIAGASTGLNYPGGVAVDTANNEIIVTNDGGDSVAVFNRTDDGNIAPQRTISGASTGLDGPGGGPGYNI